MISRHQISAARALLEWTQDDLARACGISKDMVSKIEGGKSAGSLKSLQAIEESLTVAGIEFGDQDSVKRTANSIRFLTDKAGILQFYDSVYEELKKTGEKTVRVSNVDERQFVKWQGDQLVDHTQRMQSLGVRYKILIRNGDTFFPASDYADYRWMPEGLFYSVPFYIFGEKIAFLLLDDASPKIYVLGENELSGVFKNQFESLWKQSTVPEKENV